MGPTDLLYENLWELPGKLSKGVLYVVSLRTTTLEEYTVPIQKLPNNVLLTKCGINPRSKLWESVILLYILTSVSGSCPNSLPFPLAEGYTKQFHPCRIYPISLFYSPLYGIQHPSTRRILDLNAGTQFLAISPLSYLSFSL